MRKGDTWDHDMSQSKTRTARIYGFASSGLAVKAANHRDFPLGFSFNYTGSDKRTITIILCTFLLRIISMQDIENNYGIFMKFIKHKVLFTCHLSGTVGKYSLAYLGGNGGARIPNDTYEGVAYLAGCICIYTKGSENLRCQKSRF